jgi:multidrug efflux pump subunit AcrA (membrane-fusion protein)
VLLIAGLVIAGVVAVYYMPQWQQTQAASKSGGRRGGPPSTDPVPVLATAARAADVPVYLDGVGTAKALNTVTVRSQVDGKIINISFTEGQDVPKGFVLAKIDPTTYQAQYDQAQAKKSQDEAQLANARLDLDRYTRLAATNAVNKQQLDTQRATVSQLEAQIKLDQAAIDNARAILGYTDIVAPIAGRTGIRLGRRRQSRARRGHHRHRDPDAVAADLGVLQPAAAEPAGSHQGHGRRPIAGRSPDARRQERARHRQGCRDRQPGRSDHRHGEGQG